MFTIALIGPDGAGKTTICRRIEQTYDQPVKYLYMGVSTGSSNRMLPTTRLAAAIKHRRGEDQVRIGPPIPGQARPQPGSRSKRLMRAGRSMLRLANRLVEEMYRQGLTWLYERRGNIVLCDRHFFFDYYSYDISPGHPERPLSRRIHGWFLQHIYPKPSLVIYLDAPASLLFARKREGTVEDLEWQRQEYLQMGKLVPHFEVVKADQPIEMVVREVESLMDRFAQSRRKIGRKGPQVQHDL